MAVHRFDAAAIAPTPWKNGGGSTREIVCWPPGAGLEDFDWRVSIATIAASGPFSVFPGIDRTIMLLDGDGVHLRGEGVDHRLDAPHQPFDFSGDATLDCTLRGGVSSDFNVMVRRTRLRAQVKVLRESVRWQTSAGLLMCLQGRWVVNGQVLATDSGLWWADEVRAFDASPQTVDAKMVTLACSAVERV